MTDIIDRLKEPEAHYPGNFDTPKRANAMLSCLCQEAMEEIESLRRQLKHMTDQYNAALEAEQVRYQQLCTFEAAVRHVTEEGKTKRSFSTSEGWAMVHKDRLTDLEIAEEQLAASQAREQQLLEALSAIGELMLCGKKDHLPGRCAEASNIAIKALSLPQDTTALSSLIANAGEVMRERAISKMTDIAPWEHRMDKIRAITTVTIDDMK